MVLVPNSPRRPCHLLWHRSRGASRRQSWAGIGPAPVPCASARRASRGPSCWPRSWPSRRRSHGWRQHGPPSWTGFPLLPGSPRRPPRTTLRAWSGLGYNRRALNLHRAAQRHRHEAWRPRARRCRRARGAARGRALHRACRRRDRLRPPRRRGRHERSSRPDPGRRSGPFAPVSSRPWRTSSSTGRTQRAGPMPSWTSGRWSAGRVARTVVRAPSAAGASAPGWRERPEATARPRGLPFERTSRWLRGRIVARLRELEDGAWARMPEVIGSHGPDGIAMAVAALRQTASSRSGLMAPSASRPRRHDRRFRALQPTERGPHHRASPAHRGPRHLRAGHGHRRTLASAGAPRRPCPP